MVAVEKVPAFYRGYIKAAGNGELVPLLLKSGDDFITFGRRLTEQQGLYKYAPDKWSIKEIILHLIDSERVFAYRAMRFARHDKTELSGFDQNTYVPESNADNRTIHSLLAEFTNVRAATVDLYTSFDKEIRQRIGKASGVEMSVEMIGFIISGHLIHHMNVIEEKYTK